MESASRLNSSTWLPCCWRKPGRSAKVVATDHGVAPAIVSGLEGVAAANDLDVEGALARMGGNTSLHSRSLQSYLTDLHKLPAPPKDRLKM